MLRIGQLKIYLCITVSVILDFKVKGYCAISWWTLAFILKAVKYTYIVFYNLISPWA